MTTPTSGAAIQRYKIGYHSYEGGQRSSTPSGIPDASGSWVRYADHVTALAAGQATAAQAVVQDDLITIRKPTTSAEMLWLLKLAHLVISDVDKTLEKTFAPAQPAAQQGAAYAALPDERAAFEAWYIAQVRSKTSAANNWSDDEIHGAWLSRPREEYRSSFVEQSWEAWQARASRWQAPAGATLPDGWVPLTITHEGQYPEEVAYGPQIMMDRLGKWLGKYFAQAAQPDSVQEDAALWHWLAEYLVGTRTDLDDEIVASETVNDLRKLVEAAIKQGGA